MADFTVTTVADTIDPNDGALSLREALALVDADAATADTVIFDGSVQGGRIVLAGSQLTVGSDVTIDGGSGVTIDAHQASRVLLVQSGTADQSSDVVLQHLTVTGGRTTGDDGGGIHAGDYTTLMLDHATVSGNSTAGMYADGGGIYAYSVTLTNSTVSGNSSGESDGGGIGGSDVTLANSTVSGNSAHSGGGIYGYSVTLTDSTVSGNAAVLYGGGISGNYVMLSNSIIAGNGDSGPAPDVSGSITASNGHNIFGSDVEESISGDLENVPAGLLFAGGLADNGGPTQTIALRDAADNPALAEPIRPRPRPPTSVARRGRSRPAPRPTSARSSSGRRRPSPCPRSTWSTVPRAASSCAARPVPT